MRADDVCRDERVGPDDRAVDVRLRSEMHDGVDAMVAQDGLDQALITDIAVDEFEAPALSPAARLMRLPA